MLSLLFLQAMFIVRYLMMLLLRFFPALITDRGAFCDLLQSAAQRTPRRRLLLLLLHLLQLHLLLLLP